MAFSGGGSLSVGTLGLNQNSSLSGDGTLEANVINSGVIRPGTSPGTINISGNYTQNTTGSLSIEVGGLNPGTDFDQFTVVGTAIVDGILNISLINSYEPNLGDMFAILTANTVSGAFVTVNGTSIGNGKQFQVNYGVNSVTLEVIPE